VALAPSLSSSASTVDVDALLSALRRQPEGVLTLRVGDEAEVRHAAGCRFTVPLSAPTRVEVSIHDDVSALVEQLAALAGTQAEVLDWFGEAIVVRHGGIRVLLRSRQESHDSPPSVARQCRSSRPEPSAPPPRPMGKRQLLPVEPARLPASVLELDTDTLGEAWAILDGSDIATRARLEEMIALPSPKTQTALDGIRLRPRTDGGVTAVRAGAGWLAYVDLAATTLSRFDFTAVISTRVAAAVSAGRTATIHAYASHAAGKKATWIEHLAGRYPNVGAYMPGDLDPIGTGSAPALRAQLAVHCEETALFVFHRESLRIDSASPAEGTYRFDSDYLRAVLDALDGTLAFSAQPARAGIPATERPLHVRSTAGVNVLIRPKRITRFPLT
jgi:hypothetical protein